MKISALPQKRQNYNFVALLVATCVYFPVVYGGIRFASNLSSTTVLKAEERVVKIVMKTLQSPTPEVISVVPPPIQDEVIVPPEPEVKPKEEPKEPPPVIPKKEVKKPKPTKEKKPEPAKKIEKKTVEVKDTPVNVVLQNTTQTVDTFAPVVQPEKPVTMVYGKTENTLMSQIVKSLRSNLYYPTQARRRGVQGVVLVSFVVGKNGKTEDIKVVKSSSNDELLSQAAIITVKNASSKFPKPERDIKVVVPIEFRLK